MPTLRQEIAEIRALAKEAREAALAKTEVAAALDRYSGTITDLNARIDALEKKWKTVANIATPPARERRKRTPSIAKPKGK